MDTRQEKREEEARILAEMDEALQQMKGGAGAVDEEKAGNNTDKTAEKKTKKKPIDEDTMPSRLHCKRCKTLMENGVCPTCGFTVYIPMEKEKRNKIKVVVTAVAMAIFLVVFLITRIVG